MPNKHLPTDPYEILTGAQAACAQTKQVIGHYKLRGSGFKRMLGSVDLDIIAKKPAYLYLSIASFFGQPARVVTYDGKKLYGASDYSLDEILNMALSPEDLADVLLRSISVKKSDIRTVSSENGSLQLAYRAGQTLSLTIDPVTFEILTREFRDAEGELIYRVEYKDFPKRFDITARYKGSEHSMTLTSQDAQINQGNFDEQLFRR